MPFVKPEETAPSERLLVSIWGEPKTGKSQFGLSFPRPLFYFDWDHGLEHHAPRMTGDDIFLASYSFGSSLEPKDDDYIRLLSEFDADYNGALNHIKKAGGGSIVLDTGTALWDLVQNAFFAKLNKEKKSRFDYGPPNAFMAQTFNLVKETKVANMCIIHRAKERYTSGGQAMGLYTQSGNKNVEYFVQAQLNMKHEKDRHYAIIEASWDSSALEGLELENPTYGSLAEILLPFRKPS